MRARLRLVIDPDLAEADPARQALEEAVALRQLPQGRGGARRQQPEIAGVLGDFLPGAPIDQRVEAAHRGAPRPGFVIAMGLGGVDHVIAIDQPMLHQLLDQRRRMLAVAIHEQHRAIAGIIEPGHQRRFLAEIARQRHHLHVERRRGGQAAGDHQRIVGAAVIDINHLAAQPVALLQRGGQRLQPFVQLPQPRRFIVERHHQIQRLLRRCRLPAGGVNSKRHRSGPRRISSAS